MPASTPLAICAKRTLNWPASSMPVKVNSAVILAVCLPVSVPSWVARSTSERSSGRTRSLAELATLLTVSMKSCSIFFSPASASFTSWSAMPRPVATSWRSACSPASTDLVSASSMPRNACPITWRTVPPLAGAAAAMPSVTARTTSRMPSRSKRRLRSASSVTSCTRRATSPPDLMASAAALRIESVESAMEVQVLFQGRPGEMEAHRSVGQRVDELMQVRIFGARDLLGSSLAEDHAVADHVNIVGHLERFLHVVGDHDRGEPERLVQAADQLDDLVERNRIEPGEGLVVHEELRIGGDRARERHAPRHAARQVVRHHAVRPAQADRVQLHQHQAPHQRLGNVEILADRERDVLVYRQVAEQARGLEHHAHLQAQPVELVGTQLVDVLALDPDRALLGTQLAADQLEQRRFSGAAAAEDRDHFAARDAERKAAQNLQVAVGEMQVADLDRRLRDTPLLHGTTIRQCIRTPRSRPRWCSTQSTRSACAPTAGCSRCPATRIACTRCTSTMARRSSPSSTARNAGAKRKSRRSTRSRTSWRTGRSRSWRRRTWVPSAASSSRSIRAAAGARRSSTTRRCWNGSAASWGGFTRSAPRKNSSTGRA